MLEMLLGAAVIIGLCLIVGILERAGLMKYVVAGILWISGAILFLYLSYFIGTLIHYGVHGG